MKTSAVRSILEARVKLQNQWNIKTTQEYFYEYLVNVSVSDSRISWTIVNNVQSVVRYRIHRMENFFLSKSMLPCYRSMLNSKNRRKVTTAIEVCEFNPFRAMTSDYHVLFHLSKSRDSFHLFKDEKKQGYSTFTIRGTFCRIRLTTILVPLNSSGSDTVPILLTWSKSTETPLFYLFLF